MPKSGDDRLSNPVREQNGCAEMDLMAFLNRYDFARGGAVSFVYWG